MIESIIAAIIQSTDVAKDATNYGLPALGPSGLAGLVFFFYRQHVKESEQKMQQMLDTYVAQNKALQDLLKETTKVITENTETIDTMKQIVLMKLEELGGAKTDIRGIFQPMKKSG